MTRRARCLIGAAVFAIAVLPFVPSVRHGLAPCDDYDYVRRNAEVTSGLGWRNAAWAFGYTKLGIWMPLTWLSYQADWTLFKGRPSAMHFHSIAVHGVNAVLLWVLLAGLMRMALDGVKRTDGQDARRPSAGCEWTVAALAALLWAVHPLRAESVVWVASRKDVLSMAGLLASLIAWVRARRGDCPLLRSPWYWASLAFAASGALAKPSVSVYPGLVFVLDFFVLGTFERKVAPYVAPVLLGLGVAAEGALAQGCAGAFGSQALPLHGRLMNICAAFGLYVRNTVWPWSLAVDCVQKWPMAPRGLWPGVVITGAAVVALVRAGRRIRAAGWRTPAPDWLLAGLVWFCGALLPFLTAFGIHAQADRFTYIPSVGWSLAAVGVMSKAKWGWAAGVGLVCAFAVLAVRQTGFWTDERTLYEHTLEVDGANNDRAQALLAVRSWCVDGNLDEACERFARAESVDPGGLEGLEHIQMFALAESGRIDAARALLERLTAASNARRGRLTDEGVELTGLGLTRSFRLARAAYFIATDESRRLATAELGELERDYPDNLLVFYLKGRFLWVKGERAAAVAAWREMMRKGKGENYLHDRLEEGWLAALVKRERTDGK